MNLNNVSTYPSTIHDPDLLRLTISLNESRESITSCVVKNLSAKNEFDLKIKSQFHRAIMFAYKEELTRKDRVFIHRFTSPGEYLIKIVKNQDKLYLEIKPSAEPENLEYEEPIPDFSK